MIGILGTDEGRGCGGDDPIHADVAGNTGNDAVTRSGERF
jgi:hypothetical protein